MTHKTEKQRLRQRLREKRKALPDNIQMLHARQIAMVLQAHNIWKESQHVALYLASDGEIPTRNIAECLWNAEKKAYLPLLSEEKKMPLIFAPWNVDSEMRPNRYGILEPCNISGQIINVDKLDLVLLPLVGFDRYGNRLGMGGGFYDRTFADRTRKGKKKLLIGLAHTIQYVAEKIPCDSWDIQLDGVITEEGMYCF